jgi:hypothetical protein
MPNFPLLYHYRIVPRSHRPSSDNLQAHARAWNNSKRIEAFVHERSTASHELLLFLEFVPYTLSHWLRSHLDRTSWAVREMGAILNFLRAQGIVHFDCHHRNVLTDGERLYLSDFGQALDEAFELDSAEADLKKRSLHYDAGEFAANLPFYAVSVYRELSERGRARAAQACGTDDPASLDRPTLLALLQEQLEHLVERGLLELPADYVEVTVQFREASRLMDQFFMRMMRSRRKNILLDDQRLGALLDGTPLSGRAPEGGA